MKRLTYIAALVLLPPVAFGACGESATGPEEQEQLARTSPMGAIQVSVSVTGSSLGAMELGVALDAQAIRSVQPGRAYTFAQVAAGQHYLWLYGVEKGCTVDGGLSRQVAVLPGQTETVSFAIRCGGNGPPKRPET